MIDRTWARQFAIMECTRSRPNSLSYHYADDFEMRSPLIIERMGVIEGILKRKKRSDRTGNGADARPSLQFEYAMSFDGWNVRSRRKLTLGIFSTAIRLAAY
jgi:hypothetical protein